MGAEVVMPHGRQQDAPAPVNGTPGVDFLAKTPVVESANPSRRDFLKLIGFGAAALALKNVLGKEKLDTQTVLEENARFQLVPNITENGIDKPLVVRTSPDYLTVDNQLDQEEASKFANRPIEADVVSVDGRGKYPGVYSGEWLRFQITDEKGNPKTLYVAKTFANKIPEPQQ
jgi:hypothetical protein